MTDDSHTDPKNDQIDVRNTLDNFAHAMELAGRDFPYSYLSDEQEKILDSVVSALAAAVGQTRPEKKYNDILELKKKTAWQRAKARAFAKGHAAALAQWNENLKAIGLEIPE